MVIHFTNIALVSAPSESPPQPPSETSSVLATLAPLRLRVFLVAAPQLLTDLSDRTVGRCGTNAGEGGGCNGTTPYCTSSTLTCSDNDIPENGLCQNVRAGDMPCGTGLVCSGTALSGGICQTTASTGGMCNPLTPTIRCPGTQVCGAVAFNRGTCAAVTGAETEPNDSPAAVMGSPVTTTTTRRGALTFGDVDCVAVTVAAGASVTAFVSDGNGRCPAPIVGGITLDLYGTDGTTWRGTSSNSALGRCAMIDGTRAAVFPYANALPAGTYFVCARGFRDATTTTGPISDYVLSVSTSP